MQSLKTVYSHLTNKKKELKRFLDNINAKNSYKPKILVKNKMINRRTRKSRLATRRNLTKKLGLCISINKIRIKRINVV
jgi:hypothetical protein